MNNNSCGTGEEEISRLMKKRTLMLGEIPSSDEENLNEERAKVPKRNSREQDTKGEEIDFDKLFPGWWKEDQRMAECACDFCVLYFGKHKTSSSTASDSVVLDGAQNPSTPDGA